MHSRFVNILQVSPHYWKKSYKPKLKLAGESILLEELENSEI